MVLQDIIYILKSRNHIIDQFNISRILADASANPRQNVP